MLGVKINFIEILQREDRDWCNEGGWFPLSFPKFGIDNHFI